MDAERFARVERLFHQALEREEAERGAWLAAACGDDRELSREVTSLLAAHADPATFFAQEKGPAAGDGGRSAAGAVWIGCRVGPYRLVRLLGEGGSSAVYEGVRDDGAYEGRVAVKLLHRVAWTPASLRRFHRERQILANLDHPAVAGLHDAGVTAEGVPYLILDYVEGRPIDRYCDDERLSIRERLRLMLRVCAAVEHAHRNLVLHRDIKPANVLVTPEGEPKLLDFGIATLLAGTVGDGDAETTQTGWRPMTILYASPEQLHDEPLTTASDVYSLGVLLYKLLAGRLPGAAEDRAVGRGSGGGERDEPPRPSAVCGRGPAARAGAPDRWDPELVAGRRGTRPARLRRELSGDLDNIALKALAAEPQRRYATAEQLARDLQCFLAGRPVSARPAGSLRRLVKLARRNRVAAALAALLVLAAGAYAWTAARLLGEVVRQRDEARDERDRATRISRFLVELFALPGAVAEGVAPPTAADLLAAGSERAEKELGTQPAARAALHASFGEGYRKLGLFDRAREETTEALAILRRTLGEDHPQTLASESELGAVRVEQGDFDAAARMLRSTLARQTRALPADDPEIGETLDSLGLCLIRLGRPADAEPLLRRALEIHHRNGGVGGAETGATVALLAMARFEQGDLAGAEALHLRAVEIFEPIYGRRHPLVLPSLKALARAREDRGDLAGAETLYREVLAAERSIFGDEHPRIAVSLNHLAHVELKLGRLDESERLFREGLEMRRRLLGPDHLAVAVSLSGLAQLEAHRSRWAEAERLYRQSLAMVRRAVPPDSPVPANVLVPLGEMLVGAGSPARAEPLLREAYGLWSRAVPRGSEQRARAAGALGACLAARGRYREAEPLLLEDWEAVTQGPASAEQRRLATERLVTLYRAWGREEEAQLYAAAAAASAS